MTTRHGSFVWYELMTSDVDAAARFYGSVVGWTQNAGSAPGIDYREWSIGGETVGGSMVIPAEAAANGMRPGWLGYIAVADLDASLAALTGAGGALHMPPTEVPDVGRFAMVVDPQGAGFYLMTPAGEGQSTAFSPGRPGHGGWHELHTTDNQAAFAFYGEQFGWRSAGSMDMGPMGAYLMFSAGAEAIGGMVNAPGLPPRWLYYFQVDDIEAAKGRVEAAGGAILRDPQVVPDGSWILHGRDPQGAVFALVGPR